jgi:hypothetical protein
MSYISNGCNDCSSVDFGNGLLGMSGSNNMFESPASSNQGFQQQQQQQPQFQFPQQPQQHPMQQLQMQQVQQMQQQVIQPVQQLQPVQMAQPAPQKTVQVQAHQAPKLQSKQSVGGIIGDYLYDNAFTITLAFLVASAWHTTIKYYIDHAIKFSGGTPTYYIGYAVIVTIAAIFLTTIKH